MSSSAFSQSNHIYIRSSNGLDIFEDSIITINKNSNINTTVNQYLEDLFQQSHLEANLDSFILDTFSIPHKNIAFIHKGPQYEFDKLAFDSTNIKLFKEWKTPPPTDVIDFINLRKKITTYYANNGYPFAKVYLSNLNIEDNTVQGKLELKKGHKITIDSLNIIGNLKIRTAYLEQYLNIYQGQLYDHSKVLKVGGLLSKLAFLRQEKQPDITFFYNYATINLYLKQKNTSRFDLLFGIIPTSSIEGTQLFLSLDFTAELLNKLGYGEYLYVNFERLRPEQQQFEFKFNYPYILNLPYAIDIDFKIFRNSLDYQTLQSNLGIQYLIDSESKIKVGWNVETTNIIDVDTSAILNSKALPTDLDVSQKGISIEATINRLDYRFNPRSGFSFYIKGVAGRKTINKNSAILNLSNDEVNFNDLYDAEKLNSYRYELETKTSAFLPLAQRGALGFHLSTGWRFSDSRIFRNEKFQIGGNKLLRGFDEATFFTSYYGVSTFEYRLLLSNNSYFSIPFIDIGYIENPANNLDQNNGTIAIGLGSSLGIETKAGLFNFSIAVGRTSDVDFDFKRPKAHFGFVSLF